MGKKAKTKKSEPQRASFSLNTWLFWLIIALFVTADIAGIEAEGMSIIPAPLWDMTWRIGALLLFSLFYTYLRPDIRIATLMHSFAMFAATATPISIFYYLATALHYPLIDAQLAAADHTLGFDWVAVHTWLGSVPPLQKTMSMSYYSLMPQAIVLLFLLNLLGMTERIWELPWLLLIAAIILVPFSVFTPAVGAFGYFHVNESEPYVQIFKGLYNGTLKTLDFQAMQGVVQFPSLHAASAILLIYAARGIRYAFPLYLVLNILMLAATPPLGGHYLTDVLGGGVLALVTILIVRKYCAPVLAPRLASPQQTQVSPASAAV